MTMTLILSPCVSSAVVICTVCADNVICSHRPTAEQRSLPHAWDALGCFLGSLCCEASWTLYRERWKKTLSFPSDFSPRVLFSFTSRADTLFPEPWCYSGIQASQTPSHFSSQGQGDCRVMSHPLLPSWPVSRHGGPMSGERSHRGRLIWKSWWIWASENEAEKGNLRLPGLQWGRNMEEPRGVWWLHRVKGRDVPKFPKRRETLHWCGDSILHDGNVCAGFTNSGVPEGWTGVTPQDRSCSHFQDLRKVKPFSLVPCEPVRGQV